MSTDLELLELAAKAAGLPYDAESFVSPGELPGVNGWGMVESIGVFWNPLTDDGDALRLAVALGMEVYVDTHPDGCNCVEVYSVTHDTDRKHQQVVDLEDDPYAATRRAIVRAASEIGRLKINDLARGD